MKIAKNIQLLDDNELIEKIVKSNDTHLFAVLYDKHVSMVYNKYYGFSSSKEEAQDLTHDIFIKLFVKYLLLFVFFVIGSDILGLTMVSEGIGNFIGYLPILISALAIFVVGVYIASLIQNSIKDSFKSMNISGSNLIGNVVFYIIVIFITITALNQAGVNTEIISNNLTIILGSISIAIVIAIGLGSKDLINTLLLSHYSKEILK